MSEIGSLLRLIVQADKEFKVTAVNIYGAPALFTSQLTGGHKRKGFAAYNNSNAASGEIAWGGSDCDTNGMPIPRGALVDIPVSSDPSPDAVSGGTDVYFCNTESGEIGDLRVLEIS
ncbi:MAG: hypothetical protein KAJ19_23035 [Gammaproteobacteria bacterium]|nr:hypothetical protein [Gammaproteobacteria bacterium]